MFAHWTSVSDAAKLCMPLSSKSSSVLCLKPYLPSYLRAVAAARPLL